MRQHVAMMVLTIVMGAALACGLSVKGSDPGLLQGTKADPGTEAITSETATATSFTCGSATCRASEEVCCAEGSSFVCRAGVSGCSKSSADGGTATGSAPLGCTSNVTCAKHMACCFDEKNGSSCASFCPAPTIELCQPGIDTCFKAECVPLASAPLPGLGSCVSTGGGAPDEEDQSQQQ